MNCEKERPWWAHSKVKQKEEIEDAVEWHLSQEGELTDRQKMLLRDAIGHTYRGHFGMAIQDIYELGLPENAWATRVDPALVEGITREQLRRALVVLRSSPVQNHPIFR
jgi:hypothetical protein